MCLAVIQSTGQLSCNLGQIVQVGGAIVFLSARCGYDVRMTLTAPLAPTLNQPVGHQSMRHVTSFALYALAVNAVLIQTVIPEESPFKTYLRVGVLVVVALALVLNNSAVPFGVMMLALYSVAMLAVRGNPDQLTFVFILILATALLAVKDIRRIERTFAVASVLSLVLVFAFLLLGVTHNEVLDFRSRATFGTNGVPFFFNLVYGAFAMLLFYMCKYRVRGRGLAVIGTLTVATLLFNATDARGGYLAFLAFVLLLWTMPLLARVPPVRWVVVVLPVLCLGFAAWTATQANNQPLNLLLSLRPTLYQLFFNQTDATDILLSGSVKTFGSAVDNSYIHLLVGGGVVWFLAFTFIFARATTQMFRDRMHAELAFIVATSVYFMSESLLLRIENTFVIFFWYLLLRHASPVLTNWRTNSAIPTDVQH